MLKISNNYLIVLIIVTFLLSISYSMDEYFNLLKNSKIEYKNLVLAISNIGLSLLFFSNYINFSKKETKIVFKKIIAFTILFVLTIYLTFIFIDGKNFGIRLDKDFIYQIISIIFCLLLTIYSIKFYINNKIIIKNN
jgi:hypothetical protein